MIKKFFSVFILFTTLFLLASCGDKESVVSIKADDVTLTARRNRFDLKIKTNETNNDTDVLKTCVKAEILKNVGDTTTVLGSSYSKELSKKEEEIQFKGTSLKSDDTYTIVIKECTGDLKVLYEKKDVKLSNEGTVENPILIKTIEDFSKIKDDNEVGVYFKLENDLDFKDEAEYEPLSEFKGHLDGNSKTIRNIKTIKSSSVNIGLFAKLGLGSSVKNLKLENIFETKISKTQAMYLGALVGDNLGTIDNIEISKTNLDIDNGTTASKINIGLVAGQTSGKITNVTITESSIKLDSDTRDETNVGAVAGLQNDQSVITGVNASADIEVNVNYNTSSTKNNDAYIGGLVGRLIQGNVSDSSYNGDIIVNAVRTRNDSNNDLDKSMRVFVGGAFGFVGKVDLSIGNIDDITTEGDINVKIKNYIPYIGGLAGYANLSSLVNSTTKSNIKLDIIDEYDEESDKVYYISSISNPMTSTTVFDNVTADASQEVKVYDIVKNGENTTEYEVELTKPGISFNGALTPKEEPQE